jgi:hypothetical protein
VRVNSTPGDTSLNGEQPPAVSLVPRAGKEPAIVVAWTSGAVSNGSTVQVARVAGAPTGTSQR